AVVPQDAGGEGQVVGEGGRLVEDAVAVGVVQQGDAAELFFQLEEFGSGQVGSGALGDEEPAAVVEGGEQRIAYQRRAGDLLHDEARWHLEARRRLLRCRPIRSCAEGEKGTAQGSG